MNIVIVTFQSDDWHNNIIIIMKWKKKKNQKLYSGLCLVCDDEQNIFQPFSIFYLNNNNWIKLFS